LALQGSPKGIAEGNPEKPGLFWLCKVPLKGSPKAIPKSQVYFGFARFP